MCQSVTEFPITVLGIQLGNKLETLIQYCFMELYFVYRMDLKSSVSVPALRRKASLMQVL